MKLPNLSSTSLISLDTETTSKMWWEARMFGFSVAWMGPNGVESEYFDIRQTPDAKRFLADLVRAEHVKIANHNIKYDLHVLRRAGFEIDPRRCFCTMVQAALIDEHRHRYDLDSVGKDYVGIGKTGDIYQDLADIFGGRATKEVQARNFVRAPHQLMRRYARQDAETALLLHIRQEEIIAEQGLTQIVELERRLFPVVLDMERRGIRVDVELAEHSARQVEARAREIDAQIQDIVGFDLNPRSPVEMMRALGVKWDPERNGWYASCGTRLPSTKTGKPSFAADGLQMVKHPVAGLVLRSRKLKNLSGTFLRSHVIGHAVNGRVHANINQTKGDGTGGTGTGRLSYTEPALQQIPSRDKESAAIVRPCFLPDEGQKWSYGDLDQHEYRVFAHYTNTPAIIDAYRRNPDLDIHGEVAALTGLPRSPRKAGDPNAKQLNLGMVFNMGGGTMAEQMGLPYTVEMVQFRGESGLREIKRAGPEAEEVMERYYQMVPGVRELAKKAASIARSRGYVKTLLGRHIRFPNKSFCYKASGLVYQGTSADLNKLNMCLIWEYLRAEAPDCNLLLNIHDEYSLSLAGSPERMRKILLDVKDLVQDKPMLRVPIRIDFSAPSDNWYAATEAEIWTK